ncbi:hypothetical protein [Actinomadura gamaensis]|uniref:Resolvase/invertase-type recombinase catalytic domain-containing protein n=1 Tax=Actinomadura gamaensis TaxID=1763541 RepID=A0ABV9U783_9ACTN
MTEQTNHKPAVLPAQQTTTSQTSDAPLRFAFYGRAYGSPTFAPARKSEQLATARGVVGSVGGEIVAEYFDYGPAARVGATPPLSALPWGKGPRARALIEALRRDEFDAVVVGDLDAHTFGATFLWDVVTFLDHYGTRLWIPDINGPLNPGDEVDVLLMRILIGIPIPDTTHRPDSSSGSKEHRGPRVPWAHHRDSTTPNTDEGGRA